MFPKAPMFWYSEASFHSTSEPAPSGLAVRESTVTGVTAPFKRTTTRSQLPLTVGGVTSPFFHVPRMPVVFDGIWIHNGKDERIHARHAKTTRANLLFFDGSAASFDAFHLPGVRATNTTEIRWRF